MAYFSMRQSRSSTRTWILLTAFFCTFIYFFYSVSSASDTFDSLHLVRQRKSDAAAANPLSPPTSAFRKQSNSGLDGKPRPPPVVHYQLNNLTATSRPAAKNEKILILTPLARFFDEYWKNLVALSYPHEHISLGFIIPKTKDGQAANDALQAAIKITQSGPSTAWVLWLDSDIVETPSTLIQDLASHDKPIIVPNCFQRYTDEETGKPAVRPYDYNSWRDSDTAQDLARDMGPDDILLEGYAEMPTYRQLMAMSADKGDDADSSRIMPLDGVGGTSLLVKAEVHRDGAMFPPFPFYHLIETEGFAKMAKRLGYESFGLPNYFVYHYNE